MCPQISLWMVFTLVPNLLFLLPPSVILYQTLFVRRELFRRHAAHNTNNLGVVNGCCPDQVITWVVEYFDRLPGDIVALRL